MQFSQMIGSSPLILMEGALGERLKREYGIRTDGPASMSGLACTSEGRRALTAIWTEYVDVAKRYQLPLIATTPTRRAHCDRLAAAGLSEDVFAANAFLLTHLRDTSGIVMFAGAMVGCAGNAYTGEGALSFADSVHFHRWEVNLLAKTGIDFFFAGLMPTLPEAMGMCRVLSETGIPYLVSFTVQADGRLIDGTPISEAIAAIDVAIAPKPDAYITNCVHPSIVSQALAQPFNRNALVRERFIGLQANTSDLPYCELDNACDLHTSDPDTLAQGMLRLQQENGFRLFGGCCGTDARHMDAMAKLLTATGV